MSTDFLYVFTAVAFFIWTIRSIFYWLSEWKYFSLKIYKEGFRSFLAHLFNYLISPSAILSWIFLIASFLLLFSDIPDFYIQLLILGLFIGKAGTILSSSSFRSLRRSQISFRNIVIAGFSLVFIAVFFAFPLTDKYIWLLIIDRCLFLIILFTIFIYTFPGELLDDLQGRRAEKKLKKLTYLKVIAVIGKDSSEITNIVNQILRKTLNVVTPSDEVGGKGVIASEILKHVDQSTEVFIVPVSTNNLIETSEILSMIKPDQIVLSELQSTSEILPVLSLLHSSVTKKTRFISDEMYREQVEKILKRRKCIIYSTRTNTMQGIISPHDILQKKEYLSWMTTLSARVLKMRVPLVGLHQLTYIMPAIVVADALSMTTKALLHALELVAPLPTSAVIHKMRSGAIILDASGIEEIDGVTEILDYCKLYKGRKIIIFGIQEILSAKELKIFGQQVSEQASTLYILNQRYQQSLRKVIKSGGRCSIVKATEKQIMLQVQDKTRRGDVIVFLGGQSEYLVDRIVRAGSTLE